MPFELHKPARSNFLDLRVIRQLLLQLSQCLVRPRSQWRSYQEQLAHLLSRTRSPFEQQFLNFLAEQGLRLPDEAQKSISEPRCIADFFYAPNGLIFCDGPVHNQARQESLDSRQRGALLVQGYRVIVIRWDQPLADQVEAYPEVFGKARGPCPPCSASAGRSLPGRSWESPQVWLPCALCATPPALGSPPATAGGSFGAGQRP